MYTLTQVDTKEQHFTQDHLVSLYSVMVSNGDKENANKVLDLYEKLMKNELVIAFSGHFSAGKSSMINALFGKEILPNSPIPTSANIVKIVSGDDTARIFFHNDLPIEYKEPYDFDLIKQYCQDKDTIKRIEININENILPNGCAIIDTPGIDAANKDDREMTESSLHLADLMFYVMDYNHVQSEVNLKFLQSLQEKNIPVIIIINQIDKHNEAELTFQSFKRSFNERLNEWGIEPIARYYSSLKDSDLPNNEFPEIKKHLASIFAANKNNLVNIDYSLQQLIENHQAFLQEILNEKLARYEESANETISYVEIEAVQNKIVAIHKQTAEFQANFQSELNNTLHNAYLMPASLRDQAKLFLESQQRDFRVGLFATKRKKAAIKRKRMEDFLNSLQQNINSSIEWPLRDKLIRLLKQYDITDNEVLLGVQRLSIDYTTENLISLINKGATINGNFILNYTNEVSVDIKNKFKKVATHLLEEIDTVYNREMNQQVKQYEHELKELKQLYKQQQERSLLKNDLAEAYKQIEASLQRPSPSERDVNLLEEAINKRADQIKQLQVMEQISEVNRQDKQAEETQLTVREKVDKKDTIKDTLTKIEKTIHTIETLPGFQALIDDLTDKQQRLTDRTLTVSLFGAFSAGKSSFANALIGNSILPVSPNPTTAVITRISPVTDKYTHGTVVIKLKNEQELMDDLLEITKYFTPTETTLLGLINWIKANQIHENEHLNKTYQSYLHAIMSGYKASKNKIGQTTTIELSEFASYVTDEKKACYIESVDLYYECSITKQGITIVDTPGADSINARHTNVAFDYIKNTDAILYVTYYNHAFAQADKDFLMQLGRVKDSFELDKMFFIINAADLAQDHEELQLVTDYVEEQLLKLNIRLPRVYPVSSKLSLANKLEKQGLNTQMTAFESSFYDFLNNDLASLVIQSAKLDIKRALEGLTNYIRAIDLDEVEKENYRKKLTITHDQKLQLVNEANKTMYQERISQRLDTQLYYVKQRLSIRFNDLFKDAFNPTTISGTGQQARQLLNRALTNLIDQTGYELLQELRAVSLRVEATMRQLMSEFYDRMQSDMKQIDRSFTLPTIKNFDYESPQFDQAFTTIEQSQFDRALRQFKGTKSFFVNNEREIMKQAIYKELAPFIEQYISANYKEMEETYMMQWNEVMTLVEKQLQTSIKDNFNQQMMMTESEINKSELVEKQEKLEKMIG